MEWLRQNGTLRPGAVHSRVLHRRSYASFLAQCHCFLAACDPKETSEPDTPEDTELDADSDGYPASEDCDSSDNDCDGEVDNDPIDAGVWYVDGDANGYGEADTAVVLCEQPSVTVSIDGDCDDTSAAINPDASEVCDDADADEDCSGAADEADPGVEPATQATFYPDGDKDGFVDRDDAGTQYCNPPAWFTTDATDCNDADGTIHPAAVEVCDGADNNCDGDADDGTLGTAALCSAATCLVVSDDGQTADGLYWLDSDGDGADAVEIYCDLTTDGGGWSLLTWTGDGATLTGVPYPGLSICEKKTCDRGSSADDGFLTDLIVQSSQIGIGHSLKGLSNYQNLGDYDYYDYGSMKGFYWTPTPGRRPAVTSPVLPAAPSHRSLGPQITTAPRCMWRSPSGTTSTRLHTTTSVSLRRTSGTLAPTRTVAAAETRRAPGWGPGPAVSTVTTFR